MKKLIFSIVATLIVASSITAQAITITVLDNASNPVHGVGLVVYESNPLLPNATLPTKLPGSFLAVFYTSILGEAVFLPFNSQQPSDTIYWAAVDCNGVVVWGSSTLGGLANQNNKDTLQLACATNPCEAVIDLDTAAVSGSLYISAWSLTDFFTTGVPGNQVDHSYLVDGLSYSNGQGLSPNYDSLFIPLNSFTTSKVSVCYSRVDSLCSFTCDSVAVSTPSLVCSALFTPDTTGLGNNSGQVNLLEQSSTSRGSIVSYNWNFGDGNTSTNRLPTHTYTAGAGSYAICLTTVAVDGIDTCTSTYCDTITFDANGNASFKNGVAFTINVIDPATVSLTEISTSDFSLFPNPAKGQATLIWNEGIEVTEVAVYALSGKKMRTMSRPESNLALKGLASGAYIIKISTPTKPISLRLLVE